MLEAKKVHGDKYDYSKVEYVNNIAKVCIICPKHGEFWQNPSLHLSGVGCKKCYMESKVTSIKEFINIASSVHDNKYDYSNVRYETLKDKVSIICPIHGCFIQQAGAHLRGRGCPKCYNEVRKFVKLKSKEEFIIDAKRIHGERYDYSLVDYKGNKYPVEIKCKKHGSFFQKPIKHLIGHGCPICGKEAMGKSKLIPFDELIKRAKSIHGDKYEYSSAGYINTHTKIKIKCPIHGIFEQTLDRHINSKQGCPTCALEKSKSLIYGVGENDLLLANKSIAYRRWFGILQRCYSPTTEQAGRNYKGCKVCKEWLTFSNFKKWFDENYVDGWQIDKDIIESGNRVYSPDTCCFVPNIINIFFIRPKREKRGVFKEGNKYIVLYSKFGSNIRSEKFNTEYEAYDLYCKERNKYAIELAEKYKNMLDIRVYNKLMNYEENKVIIKDE